MSWLIAMGSVRLTTTSKLMNKHAKIYVAGHRGMVGSAIVRCLQS